MYIQSFVIRDTPTAVTVRELYNDTYIKQSLEIFKLALGLLVANLLFKLINTALLDNIDNKMLQIFFTIVSVIAIFLIGAELFTFIKITSERETLLKELS